MGDEDIDFEERLILAAISESKAQRELAATRAITALSERVAVLESLQQ